MTSSQKSRTQNAAVFARVQGHVQGVGFRYSAYREALRLKLAGWVQNANDGSVEVWAEGPEEKLSQFLTWLHKGPQYSRVDSVEKENKEPRGYDGFYIEG
jgi:acylphosphatase